MGSVVGSALVPLLLGCDLADPEVAVVSSAGDFVLLADPSFSGCRWSTLLGDGDATAPRRCLPGEDRVHVKRLDVEAYCQEQAADGTLSGLCPCAPDGADACGGEAGGGAAPTAPSDPGLVNPEPTWFNYQTIESYRVGYGDFLLVEITADGLEQDFSTPGPYGH